MSDYDYVVAQDAIDAEINRALREGTPSWAVRIPAAITRAETLLDGSGRPSGNDGWLVTPHSESVSVATRGTITANQVALAKALWERMFSFPFPHGLEGGHPFCGDMPFAAPCDHCQALIAFTEKVEKL